MANNIQSDIHLSDVINELKQLRREEQGDYEQRVFEIVDGKFKESK